MPDFSIASCSRSQGLRQRLPVGHQARVARRIGARLVQPQRGRLEVAREVRQALEGQWRR